MRSGNWIPNNGGGLGGDDHTLLGFANLVSPDCWVGERTDLLHAARRTHSLSPSHRTMHNDMV